MIIRCGGARTTPSSTTIIIIPDVRVEDTGILSINQAIELIRISVVGFVVLMPHSEGVIVQVEVDDHPVAEIVIWSIDIVASCDVEGDVVVPVIGGVTTSLVRVETVDHVCFMQGHFRAEPGKQNLVNAQVVPGGIVIDLGGGISNADPLSCSALPA